MCKMLFSLMALWQNCFFGRLAWGWVHLWRLWSAPGWILRASMKILYEIQSTWNTFCILDFWEKNKTKKNTKFDHKPSFAWSCDFLVLPIEIAMKNYMESWGQTSKNIDFRKCSKIPWYSGIIHEQYCGYGASFLSLEKQTMGAGR